MSELKRNQFVAVLGNDKTYWICKVLQNTRGSRSTTFKGAWLETQDGRTYLMDCQANLVPKASVVRRIRLKKLSGGLFELPPKVKLSLDQMFNHDDEDFVKTGDLDHQAKKRKKKGNPRNPSAIAAKKLKVVDHKNDPNWRLKIRSDISVWDKDPLFEELDQEVPFVSTSANSHLVTRAVLNNDLGLLKKSLEDRKTICSISKPRSIAVNTTPIGYAILQGNVEAMQMLQNEMKSKRERVAEPRCHMKANANTTGTYNYRSLGLKHIRRLNSSRGGKEGSDALTKDRIQSINDVVVIENAFNAAIQSGVPYQIIATLKDADSGYALGGYILTAIERGHVDLAKTMIEKQMKSLKLGCTFSKFHLESLIKNNQSPNWDPPIRAVSAKKCADFKITPMHIACINPCVKALNEIYMAYPDLHMTDFQGRKPIHYSAVCQATEPLEYLIGKGVSLRDATKEGVTPLIMASIAGRPKNVQLICHHLRSLEMEEGSQGSVFSKKFGIGGIDLPQRNSWTALHHAVVQGHIDTAKTLLDLGANVERVLSPNYEKLSPLMLASARNDLEMVRMLVLQYRAKIERQDKYKRTALTHAIMNGASKTASFLIHQGAAIDKVDSSGNTLVHYACAYGWYFCLKVLNQAGAVLDLGNEWKVTPLAVSMLKGHTGLAKWLLEQPGVDINGRDDMGRTVIMGMVVEALERYTENPLLTPLSQGVLDEICYLVDRRSANPNLCDVAGKNILHYIAEWNITFVPSWQTSDWSDAKKATLVKERLNIQLKFLDSFLAYGCDVWAYDQAGQWPLSTALTVPCTSIGRNYAVIDKLLKTMLTTLKRPLKHHVKSCLVSTLFQGFAEHWSLVFIEKEEKIYKDLVCIVKYFLQNNLLDEQEIMKDKFLDKKGIEWSPFLRLCKKYAQFKSVDDEEEKNVLHLYPCLLQSYRMTKSIQHAQNKWKIALNIIHNFYQDFHPQLTYSGKKRNQSALLAILGNEASNEPCNREDNFRPGFKLILELEPFQLDPLYLLQAIAQGHANVVKHLLLTGCDINQITIDPKESQETFPLLRAVEHNQLDIVQVLLQEHGAMVYPESCHHAQHPLLEAIIQCKRDRSNRHKLQILKLLLEHGADINVIHGPHKWFEGMTGFHLALNGFIGRVDEALDLEVLLVKNHFNVFAEKDGRYPLHELFYDCKTKKDPIEVCNLLVDAMAGQDIGKVDILGRSPLHYAAACGATICCLLLINKGAELNRQDIYGNSPLAYSVLGSHDGCALILMQKGADINVKGNPMIHETALVSCRYRHLPRHYQPIEESRPLFQVLVQNDWLGLTFVALQQMEKFGMSYAQAIEVAFQMQKYQFAKRLIERQVDDTKLQEKVSNGQNLILALIKSFSIDDVEEQSDDTKSQLLEDIMNLLMQAGLDPCIRDDQGCTAFHYVCLNHNLLLLKYLLGKIPIQNLNHTDNSGRTPILALFWRTSTRLVDILKYLLEQVSDINWNTSGPMKIISHLDHGFQRNFSHFEYNSKQFDQVDGMIKYTPLIIAIAFRDKEVIATLLKSGEMDLDLSDSRGVTPLMHAVHTNDKFLVKQLIGYGVNLTSTDFNGLTALNHTVVIPNHYVTYDNAEILEILIKNAEVSSIGTNIPTLYKMSIQYHCTRIANYLTRRFPGYCSNSCTIQDEDYDTTEPADKPSTNRYEVSEDARKMLETLQITACQKETELEEERSSIRPNNGCQIQYGVLLKNYNVVMTKIDVNAGYWGFYNFYRMQIWKEKHKDMFVLFTNWGRLGSVSYGGQYQNTPFGTEESAIREFEKIFKSKSGNQFGSPFEVKKGKYRLVEESNTNSIQKKDIGFDLSCSSNTSLLKSKLPDHIQVLIKDMSSVSMYVKAYKKIGMDEKIVPFGQIRLENVMQAKAMLKELKDLCRLKDKWMTKRNKRTENEEMMEEANESLHATLEKIAQKSSEYFYLMPSGSHEFTQLPILDNEQVLKREEERVLNMLEFETAERLLLAAQYRKDELHPLDYIFQALETRMELLDGEKDAEAVHILRYIYRSRGCIQKDVSAIYRIDSKVDFAKDSKSKIGNRKLLWHGTKPENLLSIFKNGLLVNGTFASMSGRAFGDGLYFANVLDKSLDYAYTHHTKSQSEMDQKYMLLCDVALGKPKVVKSYRDSHRNEKKMFDSIHVLGSNSPDPRGTVKLVSSPGLEIPLGTIVKQESNTGLNYDEFIVPNPEQIKVRYIVRFQ